MNHRIQDQKQHSRRAERRKETEKEAMTEENFSNLRNINE